MPNGDLTQRMCIIVAVRDHVDAAIAFYEQGNPRAAAVHEDTVVRLLAQSVKRRKAEACSDASAPKP